MYATLRVSALALLSSVALAGCAGSDMFGSSSSDLSTSSVAQTQAQKVDPACGNLALEIDTLRRDGVAEKVEKAAAKKYKMKPADLDKANQLNRANADFQAKCSSLPRTAATPTAPASMATVAPAAVKAAPAAAKGAAAPAKSAAVAAASQ